MLVYNVSITTYSYFIAEILQSKLKGDNNVSKVSMSHSRQMKRLSFILFLLYPTWCDSCL